VIRIRFSRCQLRWALTAALAVAGLVVCYRLGDHLTPRSSGGRPLILSPSVYAAEGYRRTALRWVAEMAEIDRRLSTLLDQEDVTDPAHLYALSGEVEQVTAQAEELVRQAAFTACPPALVELSAQLRVAAEAHLETAWAGARWVSVPEPQSRRAALESLRQARGLRTQLEAGRWLASMAAPEGADGN